MKHCIIWLADAESGRYDDMEKFANEKGMTVHAILVGVRNLANAVERVQPGGVLLVCSATSISTNPLIVGRIEQAVQSASATLVCADGGAPERTVTAGEIALSAELARVELNRTRGNTRRKLMQEGKRMTGAIPYGWTLNDDGKTMSPNTNERMAIEHILGLHKRGLTQRQIMADLNRHGLYKARTASGWNQHAVCSILKRSRITEQGDSHE
jgi:hypothetical protein